MSDFNKVANRLYAQAQKIGLNERTGLLFDHVSTEGFGDHFRDPVADHMRAQNFVRLGVSQDFNKAFGQNKLNAKLRKTLKQVSGYRYAPFAPISPALAKLFQERFVTPILAGGSGQQLRNQVY